MTTKQGVEFDRIINAPVPGLGWQLLTFFHVMKSAEIWSARCRAKCVFSQPEFLAE